MKKFQSLWREICKQDKIAKKNSNLQVVADVEMANRDADFRAEITFLAQAIDGTALKNSGIRY